MATTNVCQADAASCGCCLMHQQIDRMKRSFNQSLAELQNELNKAMDTLNQFRSTRSAFSVSLFTDNTQTCYGPFRDDTLVVYKHIFLNMGDNYDVSSGVFTVPRTGVYSLALTVYSDAGAPGNTLAACASLQVNGHLLAGPREFYMQDQEDSATTSIVVKLRQGEMVSVNLPIGCFLCDNKNHYNTFSGFLLYTTE
ncbi:complement C1q-like protein 4 [Periophthalmus magnuspinnatus]|uniref:complement C1q-like protein 4 n=1 Tax=Periophthalmus magnuspinnatus TaxID=409849 RepID=UPI002436BCE7|nr:complement C1q-like protein 4 [Periophthalmus magnuspinnatus]